MVSPTDITYNRGDWVRVNRAPAGYSDYVRSAYGAQVVDAYQERVRVNLFDVAGQIIQYDMSVLTRNVSKVDAPTFRNKTSHIPETAEVLAAKKIIWEHAMRVKRETGMCGVLETTLKDLGIQKPPPGRVKAKLVFELEVDIDRLIAHSNHERFAEDVASYTNGDLARTFMSRAQYSEAKIEYEVVPPTPPTPVVVPAPVGQSSPTTGPAETAAAVATPTSVKVVVSNDEEEEEEPAPRELASFLVA